METPRQRITRLNAEQRAMWDGHMHVGTPDQHAQRLQAINVELAQAWNDERVTRAGGVAPPPRPKRPH